MGYRARLGKIAKSEREKYKGKTSKEVEKIINDDNILPYRLKEHKQLYELGKNCNFKIRLQAFYSFSIYKEYEAEFHILSKTQLKQIITEYHDLVLNGYEEDFKCGDIDKIKIGIAHKINEWNRFMGLLPYYLDQPIEHSDGMITPSWKYEYAIFNLVYIYRTFDWKNDYLIYSAW